MRPAPMMYRTRPGPVADWKTQVASMRDPITGDFFDKHWAEDANAGGTTAWLLNITATEHSDG